MRNGLSFSILVVDDDEDDRLMINEAFMAIGYAAEVKKFIDGKMLLHYLEQLEPSLYPALIVLDNTLPGLNAIDLLRILRNNLAYTAIRIVVYTSMLAPSKEEQLLAAGAHACFEKGDTMHDLVRVATKLRNIAESNLEGS